MNVSIHYPWPHRLTHRWTAAGRPYGECSCGLYDTIEVIEAHLAEHQPVVTSTR